MNGMNDFEKQLAMDIREIRAKQDSVEDMVYAIKEDVAVSKVKHGTIGAIAGGIGGGIAMGIKLLFGWIGGHS